MPADPFDKFNVARAAAANKEAQRKENIGRFVAKLQEKHAQTRDERLTRTLDRIRSKKLEPDLPRVKPVYKLSPESLETWEIDARKRMNDSGRQRARDARLTFEKKERAQTPPPWAKEGPGGRDFAQEDAAARLKIKALKAKADTWAAKEKADIESGAKKPPMTSKEKIMAENKKPKTAVDLGEKYPGATAARVDARRATAQFRRTDRGAIDLGEKYPGTTGQTIENARQIAKGYRAARAISEGRIGDPSEFSDLAVPRSFKPNMPAAAESRMKANKPLKTALVREVEPGRSRNLEAKMVKKYKGTTDGKVRGELEFHRMQSAAETGEAQAFVGQMKPGVAERTAAHKLQSREFNYPPANQSKDLGRAVTNTIRREQAPGLLGSFTEPPGGSLMKLAKTRAAQGRSIAGPDAPAVPENRRGMYKGKPAGVAPTVTLNSRAKGWNKIKAIEPGELPDTD